MIEHVEEILTLYAKLTGYKFSAGLNENNWELDKRMNRLARAQKIEPTNALFLMLLDEQLEGLLKSRSYTAFDLMDPESDGAKRFATTAKIAGRIRELLATSGMPEVREQLQADMMRALRHYDAADRDEAKKFAEGRFEIANLWFSALNAMEETLDTFQFLQGEPETTTPKYVEHVLGFWSINDAIRLAMSMPNGAAMCLIRQPEGIHSFFAFVIRNGGNVSVITDKTKWAHPLAHQRSRRPDRHLDERMQRSWFPYELLEIQYLTDEDGDVVGLNVPRQEGIIPQQQRAFKLKKIKSLGGEEIVWTAFMFSLITKKFFRENWKAPELTYTGEMVEVPQIAAAAAYHANLPVPEGAYKPLQAERLHSADLLTDKVLVDAGIRSSTRANEWMEKRYADKVPDVLLNMVASPSLHTTYLRGDGTTTTEKPKPYYGAPKPISKADIVGKVHHYDATDFGSAEQVLSNRVWIARHNQAEAIAALAMQEFEARKAEILQWWEDCIDMNLDALLAATWDETFVSTSSRLVNNHSFKNKPRGDLNLMHKHTYDHRISLYDRDWADLHSLGHLRYGDPVQRRSASGHDYNTGKYRCHVTERPATILVQFLPRLPEDLAAIAGVTMEKLPDVLQHWGRDEPYTGNSILNRLDPLEDLSNPWKDLKFGVSIFLSPFAYKHKDFPKAAA